MKLFRLFILTIAISSFIEKADCQTLLGVKGGANLTKGIFDGSTTNYALNYHAGLISQIHLTNKIGLDIELLYSRKGWKIPNDALNHNERVNLTYLNLPILLNYKVIEKLSVYAGPEFGYKINETGNKAAPILEYEKFDFGITFGARYTLYSKLGIDLRYVYGFKDLIKSQVIYTDQYGNPTTSGARLIDGSNRAFMLGVYYLFNSSK